MNNRNDLQVTQGNKPMIDMNNQKEINAVINTVAKNATEAEFMMFAHLCNEYQLDPFRKEIWFIKYGNEPTIMTSRDGYLKIAQRNPDFLGLNSQEVRENDYFKMDPTTGTVVHEFAQPISNRGNIVGAWAVCKRKGIDPVSIFVNFDEYKGPPKDKKGRPSIWGKYPSAMIIKVAEAFALKRQFNITGLVTREELDAKQDDPGSGQENQQNNSQQRNHQHRADPPPNASEQQTEQQESDNVIVPSNADIQKIQIELGLSNEQMTEAINHVRVNNGEKPAKWSELDADWKIAIFDLMWKRLQKVKEARGE